MEGEPSARWTPVARPPIIDWPEATRGQLRRLVDELEQLLAGNLIGIYLHGSLALGCFNPTTSDLDLLTVTARRISAQVKRSLVASFLSLSGSPHPIEISSLCRGAIRPWRYPTPFDLHYSETWRTRYEQALTSDGWLPPVGFLPASDTLQTDADLAAHIGVTRERGIELSGQPIEGVLPIVPERDLRASLLSDLRWARSQLDTEEGLRYGVLNACRACAYLRERRIYSKLEGARWALVTLSRGYHAAIGTALEAYRSIAKPRRRVKRDAAERLIDEVISEALREADDS